MCKMTLGMELQIQLRHPNGLSPRHGGLFGRNLHTSLHVPAGPGGKSLYMVVLGRKGRSSPFLIPELYERSRLQDVFPNPESSSLVIETSDNRDLFVKYVCEVPC